MRFPPHIALVCIYVFIVSIENLKAKIDCLTEINTETLQYDLYLHNLPVAKAQLVWQRTDSLKLFAQIDTNPFMSIMFYIHNNYETVLNNEQKTLIRYEKTIQQHNISQNLQIFYDHKLGQANGSNGSHWKIKPNTHNLFSMLHFVRCALLSQRDSIHFNLDVESQAWNAIGTISQINGPVISGHTCVNKVVICFSRPDTILPRHWKTDLLTNRITKGGKLIVLLGGSPYYIPFLIQFGDDKSKIEMRFTNRK